MAKSGFFYQEVRDYAHKYFYINYLEDQKIFIET